MGLLCVHPPSECVGMGWEWWNPVVLNVALLWNIELLYPSCCVSCGALRDELYQATGGRSCLLLLDANDGDVSLLLFNMVSKVVVFQARFFTILLPSYIGTVFYVL